MRDKEPVYMRKKDPDTTFVSHCNILHGFFVLGSMTASEITPPPLVAVATI
jgi:hypothetical protein